MKINWASGLASAFGAALMAFAASVSAGDTHNWLLTSGVFLSIIGAWLAHPGNLIELIMRLLHAPESPDGKPAEGRPHA